MEAKFIIVTVANSNKSENKVYKVGIMGEEKPQGFCKSAYKAMRYMFLLKKKMGLNISENCLAYLSKEIKLQKESVAVEVKKKVEELAESHSVDKVLEKKEKKARKPRAKKIKAAQ